MSVALPPYYFRLRDAGVAVFRVDTSNRERRLELIEIAFLNLKNGNLRPHGGRELSLEDRRAIAKWQAAREAQADTRAAFETEQLLEAMNRSAHWLQSQASPAQVEAVADRLLLALHDLRSTVVRRKADALREAQAAGGEAEPE